MSEAANEALDQQVRIAAFDFLTEQTRLRGETLSWTRLLQGFDGVALCKLHHAAFYRCILGIPPDLVVDLGWMSGRRTGRCSCTGCRGSRA